MIKIQTHESEGQLVIQVEGRLVGAYVPELEICWRRERETAPGRGIWIDLKGVTCVDRAGRQLLMLMHGSGVGFRRAGLAIQDILQQIKEHAECRH